MCTDSAGLAQQRAASFQPRKQQQVSQSFTRSFPTQSLAPAHVCSECIRTSQPLAFHTGKGHCTALVLPRGEKLSSLQGTLQADTLHHLRQTQFQGVKYSLTLTDRVRGFHLLGLQHSKAMAPAAQGSRNPWAAPGPPLMLQRQSLGQPEA